MNNRSSSVVLWSVFLVGLVGCSGSRKLESKIVSRIQKCSGSANCQIAISEVTTFDWDKFYAFKYSASLADREKALGVHDEGFQELRRQLVFLKDGKVIYQESEPTNVEHPVKDEVIFDIPDDGNFKAFGRDARFLATAEQGVSGSYFLLKQVQ